MKIAIIGAGFTGISAAAKLVAKGHRVTVFEKEKEAGGLARGFKGTDWAWPLEQHYHHLFTSDTSILNFAKAVGVDIDFKRPKTSTFADGETFQIDSPLSLLKFPKVGLIDRLRIGFTIACLKLTNNWRDLEKVPAGKFLIRAMGKRGWSVLWKPLFVKKFGSDYPRIPASWFWARIKKRSAGLGYPRGGFQKLIDASVNKISKMGAEFVFKSQVTQIAKHGLVFELTVNGKKHLFDRVICTLPSKTFLKMALGLQSDYRKKLTGLKGIGAVNLVLNLKRSFLVDGTYWLNINDTSFPFLCLVEQTNFVGKGKYNHGYPLYIGNYLKPDHKYFKASKRQLLKEFLPYLKQINPEFNSSWIKESFLFKTPFAQPVTSVGFSKRLPKLATPLEGLYLASLEQVYPWDRGTNYSIELGWQVAELIG